MPTRYFKRETVSGDSRGRSSHFMSKPIAGRYLSFAEREDIALLSVQGLGVREIARRLGRSPSTVSRELKRNAATRGGCLEYRASVAQWKAERFAKRPKAAKLATNAPLRQYVQERLEGKYMTLMVVKLRGPGRHRSKGAMNHIAVTESGSTAGHLNRLPIDCRLISRMMNLCASLTKPFIKRSIFKGAERSSASWWVAFAPGARCAFPERERAPGRGRTSARR
ncbi:hypothetical protein LMG28727_07727 [Paraburkholderia kirstenboschensis]|nr:hypothetical protein LMG28727_07727 [Paraburkholderia kirstenboschensis]